MRAPSILISEPQLMEMGLPYLPIMWGILKTYWEREGGAPDAFDWPDPIHHMGEVDALLAPYDLSRIAVLGLSCYTWNWHLQCRIAARVKAANPACLIVAGGPEPDFKDPHFFERHPYIDMIAVKDGEITFTRLLQAVLARENGAAVDIATIRGLYLPVSGGPHRYTGAPDVPKVFDYSPYVEQSAFYERLRASLPGSCVAVWETNRGCPYKCSYCDWGSNTMSKLRVFDLARAEAEIDWFGRLQIGFIMSADANYGILERDLALTDRLIATQASHGAPSYFTYNAAKNNPDRTLAIARKLIHSGLTSAHVLSIQHTDRDVLAATERFNISVEKQIEVVREMLADDIPIYVQLILGIPGDTYEKWKTCFYDLMEWGVHSYYWVFPYNLLPNAPAAEPAFRDRWQIETVERYVLLNHGGRPPAPIDPVAEAKSRLVIGTTTFDREGWIEMQTAAACIKALHNCSVTQLLAIYLRFSRDVPYRVFYDDLIENWLRVAAPGKALWDRVAAHYRDYLDEPEAVDFIALPQLPDFLYHMDPSRWIFIQICMQLDPFFAALSEHLVRTYGADPWVTSVTAYQRNLIILPDYDKHRGTEFDTAHDWIAYFARAQKMTTYAPLPPPAPMSSASVRAVDTAWHDAESSLALDWQAGAEDWSQWIHTMVIGRNSSRRNNFQKLGLFTGRVGAAAAA